MKKSVILFVLILSIIMPSQVSAQYSFNTLPLYDSEETVTFIVEMEDRPVLSEIKLSQENEGSVKSRNAQTYRSTLLRSHKRATDAISSKLSDNIKPRYTYTEIFNGFAIKAKYKDMEVIKGIEGVKGVYVSARRKVGLRMGNAPSMTHSLPSETSGYTGSGQVIAVIDNEFDVKHVAFSKAPQNPKYTKKDISSVLSDNEFNASSDVNRVYESDKIPFRYDYGEKDADTYSSLTFHGTHVAGIAAGNSPDGEFRGVAPDAQLVLMKIADSEGYMENASIAAALDDAAKLGVCAINCSYGDDFQAIDVLDPVLTTCYENAYNAGIFLSVAAGNRGRGFVSSMTETMHIDDSATGTPNALDCAISVGSVENSLFYRNVSEITLWDGNVIEATMLYDGSSPLTANEYVYCGFGFPENFESLDAEGKIAVIDRGIIPFVEKSDAAKAAGAVGVIIINTEDDYDLSPELSLPAVCVRSSDGDLFRYAEVKTITSVTPFNSKAYEADGVVSYFSSYGTTENLGLKPEISAPGGNIYSTVPGDEYKYNSGTSMSAPHISGVVAIINQYLEDTGCAKELSDRVDLIRNMMMSSADVVYIVSDDEENKIPYSPRVQGAGMVNTANAIKTPVILYSDNGSTKIEFGDNLTDTLEIKFTAQNLTENDVVYDKISAVALTDGYVSDNGINYIYDTRLLKSELITDSDTVIVPANSTVTVSAQLKLDSDELYENSLIFQNGFHIDGFIRLENTTEDIVSVGMPFMGFYGNWTKAPVFDTTMYDEGGSRLIYGDEQIRGTVLLSNYEEEDRILGYNHGSDRYNYDSIAISPDGDGYCDFLGVQFTPERSIKDLKIYVTDEDGNILSTKDIGVVNKFYLRKELIEFPEDISDGSYFVTLEGYMNYNTENSLKHSMSIPFKVDRQKALIKSCKLEGNVLTVDVHDDSGIYYLSFTDSTAGSENETFFETFDSDGKITYVFEENNIPDLSNIRMDVIDNAINFYSYYLGGFDGKIGAEITEIFTDEKSYTISFALTGDDEFSDASFILAFYDENGSVLHTNVMKNRTVSSGEYEFAGDFSASTADKCKLFIWLDDKSIKPLDSAKIFDMNVYGIKSGMQ